MRLFWITNHAGLKVFLLMLFTLLFLISPAHTSSFDEYQKTDASDIAKLLDQRIPKLMQTYEIPGVSILIIKNRKPIWQNAYGYASLAEMKKMAPDAVFRVESISKSITTWGVMKLAERGVIELDDPIHNYINMPDELTKNGNELIDVTIENLLNNSAGISQGTFGHEYPPAGEIPTLQEYLNEDVSLNYTPGSKFQYSNPGFNLLELLIEEVTGRQFSEFMESEILTPLGMNNSSYSWNEGIASKIPLGYDLNGEPVRPYIYPYKASGGLLSNIHDIARFSVAEMSEGLVDSTRQVISSESVSKVTSHQIHLSGMFGFVADSYGFGHFVETLPTGNKAVWHGGQGHGWMSHFHLIPETGDGIVILTNSQRSWPFIANILNEWSHWHGAGTVKFSNIVWAVKGLRMLFGIIILLTTWKLARVINQIKKGLRLPFHICGSFSLIRISEMILALTILGGLVWSMAQDYLFISSIFPIGAAWLGWTLFYMSLVLLFSALTPSIDINPSD